MPTPIGRLLSPRSVALAGVSTRPGSLAGTVLRNLEQFGFPGPIHLIHPTAGSIGGRACVPGVEHLPFGVDCVVLAIPVAAVLQAVTACARHGVGGVVIFSAGFAELGAQGAALQAAIAAVARAAGMAIEGPNCLGFVNYADRIPLTFAVTPPRPLGGPAACVVSQSGAMASVVRASLQSRDIDVAFAISTGNEAANGLEDFVEHLLGRPETRLLVLVAEHIRDPQRFLHLADQAHARAIPIVLLHPGQSTGARHAVATHTGALAGDHAVMRAVVERHAVLLADTLEELVDLAECLLRAPVRLHGLEPPPGVAVLGESGAFKALTLDYGETLGIVFPEPEGDAAAELDSIAPGFIVASNPLDLTAQALGDPGLYGRAIDALMANPRCGALLVAIILTSAEMAWRKMPPVIEVLRHWAPQRLVVFAMLGDDTPVPEALIAEVRAAGVPFFRSPERALRCLARLAAWAAATPGPPPGNAPETIAPAPRLPAGTMPEHAAKDVLERAGLRFPERRLARDLSSALQAAAGLDGPVALKIQAAALSHKSDVGGVVLNLVGPEAVAAGWDRLHAAVGAAAPDTPIEGVLVERMAAPGLELILGAKRDPHWGVVVAVGLGGVFAEVLRDVRILPAGLGTAEVVQALHTLKGAAMLGPVRGRPARDVAAVAAMVVEIGRFMQAHPEVSELDLNPVIALAEGHGAVALDALIVCDRP